MTGSLGSHFAFLPTCPTPILATHHFGNSPFWQLITRRVSFDDSACRHSPCGIRSSPPRWWPRSARAGGCVRSSSPRRTSAMSSWTRSMKPSRGKSHTPQLFPCFTAHFFLYIDRFLYIDLPLLFPNNQDEGAPAGGQDATHRRHQRAQGGAQNETTLERHASILAEAHVMLRPCV